MSGPITLDDPSAYFERLDAFERSHWWPRAMRRIALVWLGKALGDRSGLAAIDVGCGNGRMVGVLAGLPWVGSVLGIEPEREALRRADRSVRAGWIQGSATALPFACESADLITCLDVLQHLPSGGDAIALDEFARVLRPEGLLLIRSNAGGMHGYRLAGLRTKVKGAGFWIERAAYVNGLPALAQEIRGRLSRGGGHPEGMGLPKASPGGRGSRLMGWIASVEAEASVRLGIDLPYGHGTMVLARKRSPDGP